MSEPLDPKTGKPIVDDCKTPTTGSYVDGIDGIDGKDRMAPLPDDLSAIGITLDMLKGAAKAYNEAFVRNHPALPSNANYLELPDL